MDTFDDSPPRSGGKNTSGAPPKRYSRRGKPRYGFFNYPRKQYTGFHRWVPSWRFLWWSFVACTGLLIGAFVVAYEMIKVPDAADMAATAETSTVYYADGGVMGKFEVQNRDIIDIAELPAATKNVIVAAEDRTFWDNAGVDPLALARAFYNNLKGGKRQGGSTITQQYVERYYFGQTTTSISGKLKEAMLALKITRTKDKDVILGDYMNTIYFGRGSYGIQAAAQAYFAKDAKELTVSEAAMLAGLIPAPTAYDPEQNLKKAEQRWNYVLDGMVIIDALSQAERDALVFPPQRDPLVAGSEGWIPYDVPESYAGQQGYLLEMVRQELLAKGINPEENNDAPLTDELIGTLGLEIRTTIISKESQEQLAETVRSRTEKADPGLHVAVASIEPSTGAIKMVYAGDDYIVRQQNAATQDIAQAGSVFKPITLAAALQAGHSLNDVYSGKSPITIDKWKVRNSGNAQYGDITLLQATMGSVNTVYAQLNRDIKPASTRTMAVDLGLPPDTMDLGPDLANVLGTASVHAMDMAQVYATFANQGVRQERYIVQSAVDPDGGDYVGKSHAKSRARQIIMAEQAEELNHALVQVVEAGTGTAAKSLGRQVAGKTGTSEDNKSAWFCGSTPELTTAVAFYQEGPNGEAVPLTPFGGSGVIQGGGPPTKMWVAAMEIGLRDHPEKTKFPEWKGSGKSGNQSARPSGSPSDEATPEPSESVPSGPEPSGSTGPVPDPGVSTGPDPDPDPTPPPAQSTPPPPDPPPAPEGGG
ncbi:MAG: penicillin-binding protein [Bifidobacteriaceae bacterium]|jgi:membrane peptidoglycan carboxypeptidase|nr:penicillin-binding protein [Bifidobacteriaceae bacterium]